MGQLPDGINERPADRVLSGSALTRGTPGFRAFPIERRGNYPMPRVLLLAAPLLILAVPAVAPAQDPKDQPAQSATSPTARSNARCDETSNTQRRRRGRTIGGILGAGAGMFGGAVGGVAGTVTSLLPVGEILGEAIASMLDCREQQQAAGASEQAVRGGVGTTTAWTSETRPGVTGSSVATGEERLADGTHCMTVTDIVIVDGEETRAPKRMCRAPGAARYARV